MGNLWNGSKQHTAKAPDHGMLMYLLTQTGYLDYCVVRMFESS